MLLDFLVRRPEATLGRSGTQWLVEALGGETTHAGVQVTTDKALSYSAVWAAVRIITQSIAALPWHVFQRRADGGREVQEDHGVDWLLHREASDCMTALGWRDAMQTSALLYGNGYSEILRNPLTLEPIAMVPLNPRGVSIKEIGGELLYTFQPEPQGEPYKLRGANVFHLKGIGSGWLGFHLVDRAKESIGLGMAEDTFAATFFGNNARAGGFLKHPKTLDDTARTNLLNSLKKKYGGPERSNKVWILEEGMEFQQNTVTPDEAQFIESRTYQVQEVSRWFGVPPHMLAEMSRATFSNIESQAIEFVKYAVAPWVVRYEREADRKLFSVGERRSANRLITKMDLNGLMRGDSKARSEYYRTMWNMGSLSINEIRALEDMNPTEDGNRRFVPLNMTPLDNVDAAQEQRTTGQSQFRQDVAQSFYRVLYTSAEALVAKEAKTISRSRKTGTEYLDWLSSFYTDHETYIYEQLFPIAQSFCELAGGHVSDFEALIKLFASQWVSAARDAATDKRQVTDWPSTKPQRIARELLSKMASLAQLGATDASRQQISAEPDTRPELPLPEGTVDETISATVGV